MMLRAILQEFADEAQEQIEQLQEELEATLDIARYEQGLKERLDRLAAELTQTAIEELLAEREMLAKLRQIGGKLALRFKEYRRVRVRLANGQSIEGAG